MAKYEIRRLQLLALRDRDFDRSNAALARRIGKDGSYVARMLYPMGKPGKKRIGEESVEMIENAFYWPRGWLSSPAALPAPDVRDVRRINLQAWMKQVRFTAAQKPYLLKLLSGPGFDAATARELEHTYELPENTLDMAPRSAPAPRKPQVSASAPPPSALAQGAFFAACRNGGRARNQPEFSILSEPLQRVCDAYDAGGLERRLALIQVADLPTHGITALLQWLGWYGQYGDRQDGTV